jgi:hypothetical protein
MRDFASLVGVRDALYDKDFVTGQNYGWRGILT